MSGNEEIDASIRPLLKLSREHIVRAQKLYYALVSSLERAPLLVERLERLRTVPGVGPITALTWAREIGDVARFRSIKQAISYSGLYGAKKSSADKAMRMPISKQRNKHIQQVLVEATALRLASCLSGRGESMPENEHPRQPCQECFAQSRNRLTRRASRSCRGCIPTSPPPPLRCPAQGPSETPCHPG